MREKSVEKKLCQKVKKRGGIAPKFVSPGFSGVPDRIVLLPDGKLGFVETKAPGKRARPLQIQRHKILRALGFKVYVLDDVDDVEMIIDDIQTS